MSVKCFFCKDPVNPHDLGTWKRVTGWVGGPRKDAMTMREDTGEYAHAGCVNKARDGQVAEQPDFDEVLNPPVDNRVWKEVALDDLSKFKELYNK
jgi:hypothetical protein